MRVVDDAARERRKRRRQRKAKSQQPEKRRRREEARDPQNFTFGAACASGAAVKAAIGFELE